MELYLLVFSSSKAMYRWMREVIVSAMGALDHGGILETKVDILWVTGLFHTKMTELAKAEFRHHHVVSSSLNIH